MKKQEQVYVCSQCVHFIKHYVKYNENIERYTEAGFGHCVYPRIKSRRVRASVCAHFEERAPQEVK